MGIRPALLLLPLWFALGCSQLTEHRVGKALEEGRWDEATTLLEEEVRRSPGRGEALRDLARAHLGAGRIDEALARLDEAREVLPGDRSLPLLTALCREKKEEWQEGIEAYHAYPGSRGSSPVARAVRGRISRLVRRAYADRAAARLLRPVPLSENLLAVRYFTVAGEEYDGLGKGIADLLIADLRRIEDLLVVPRLFYEEIAKEERGRPPAGTEGAPPPPDVVAGASWSLGGTIASRGEEKKIEITFYLTDNRTGEVQEMPPLAGPPADFFDLEKRIAFEVAEKLGVSVTRAERQAIAEVPTADFRALLAYGRALDEEDGGDYEGARRLFEEAIRLDPGFLLAGERAGRAAGSGERILAIIEAEIALPERQRRARRSENAWAMLRPSPLPGRGEAADLSNVRPLGAAEVTIRVERP